MAVAMDRPDIAKKAENYQPQPDPMAQRAQELTLAEQEANAAKDMALAENAKARTVKTYAEAQEKAEGIAPKMAQAQANVAKTISEINTSELDSAVNAADRLRPQPDRAGKNVK
jgi:hypothetical protein